MERFRQVLGEQLGIRDNEHIMLAVSGGVDSVVMTDLFVLSGYPCTILHCNFRLRATESDADEAFVRKLASSYDLPVYVKSFETLEHAEDEGISVQMAARELRYSWFDDISDQLGCQFIATAHNLNDSVETVLLNLTRGSGIRGLTGIPMVNRKYIRPLLFASRDQISEYARVHRLDFREDSSNSSKKYHRNRIRHDVIPVLESINPSFLRGMEENIKRISDAVGIFKKSVSDLRNLIFHEKDTHMEIETDRLRQLEPLSTWLYELFSEYNFTREQCLAMEKLLESDSGKQFISVSHRIYKDRDKLLLYRNEDTGFERYYIDSPDARAALPFPMDIEVIDAGDLQEIPPSPKIAALDLDRIDFPLTIRKWQDGDFFFPLGMPEKMKKLSDFFIDLKIPVPEKKRTWIMASGRKIVWVMGLRIDDRFKVTRETSRIMLLQMH